MIQTPDKTYKEIRTVFDTDAYSVSVCRSLSKGDPRYYTILRLRDPKLQKRILNIFSQHPMHSSVDDFIDIATVESEVIVIFNYHKEKPYFYYQSLYCRQFADRLFAAKDLTAELMASSLPLEIKFFLLEECNINITADKQIYFNYFTKMDILPDNITLQDFVNKAAETILRILSEDLKALSREIQLFQLKVERKAFRSLADIYSDLKKIPVDSYTNSSLFGRIARFYHTKKLRIFFVSKVIIFAVLVAASMFYTITEWKSRSIIAASQNLPEPSSKYQGIERIGTVELVPNETHSQE